MHKMHLSDSTVQLYVCFLFHSTYMGGTCGAPQTVLNLENVLVHIVDIEAPGVAGGHRLLQVDVLFVVGHEANAGAMSLDTPMSLAQLRSIMPKHKKSLTSYSRRSHTKSLREKL